jgi:HK97 family phage prohead protease
MSSAFYDIQYKASAGQVNLDQAQGIVECFVAGIGNKDSVGDVCATGAFTKSLMRRKPRVVWGHNWNDPIGKVIEIYEVPANDPRLPAKMRAAGIGGLYAKVQFNLNSEKGKEAFANVAFFGEEQEWSIGYKTLRAQFDPGIQANILYEVELYEVSPVLHGANQLTGTISVKSDEKGGMMPMMAPPMEKPTDDETEMQEEMERKLQEELSARLGSPVKVLKMNDGVVYFSRENGEESSSYKCRYHMGNDGVFMFGRPERFQMPQAMPVAKPVPRMPMGMPSRPMAPTPGAPPVVVPALVPGATPASPPMVRFNYDETSSAPQAEKPKLVAEERDLAEALVKITKRYGKFNEDSTGVWAGYKPAAENPVAKIGVKCANCIMFEGEGKCKIIDKQVEPEGKCRFAIIPEGVVSMGPVQKVNYDIEAQEEEVKWLEDIEAKYPGEFVSGTLRNAVKRRRKRRMMGKKVFRIDEYQEKSLEDFLESDMMDISYVLPVNIDNAFEIKQMIDPIIDYHMVDAVVVEDGIVFTGGVTKDFVAAVGAAVSVPFHQTEQKALGRNLAGRITRTTRGLTARFDPNAWDGDNDGIVQEGTPFERPAIPGVNDFTTRGKVNKRKARQAWKDYKKQGKPAAQKKPEVQKPDRQGLSSGMSGEKLRPAKPSNNASRALEDSIGKQDYNWGIDDIVDDFEREYLDNIDMLDLEDAHNELVAQFKMNKMKALKDGVLNDDVLGDDFDATAKRIAKELNLDEVDADKEAGRVFDARDAYLTRAEQYKQAIRAIKRRIRNRDRDLDIAEEADRRGELPQPSATRRDSRRGRINRGRPQDGILDNTTKAGRSQEIKDRTNTGIEKFDIDKGLSSGSSDYPSYDASDEEWNAYFERAQQEREARGPRPYGDELPSGGFKEDLSNGPGSGTSRIFRTDVGWDGQAVIHHQDDEIAGVNWTVLDPENMPEDLGSAWYMGDMSGKKKNPIKVRPGWYVDRMVFDDYEGYYTDEADYDFSYSVGPFNSPEDAAKYWADKGLNLDADNRQRAINDAGETSPKFEVGEDGLWRKVDEDEAGLSSGARVERKYPPRYESSKKLADLMESSAKPNRSDYDYSQDSDRIPTDEQKDIIDAVLEGNDVVVGALAGSGKTSTLVSIARRLRREDPNKKVVYLAFNKSAAQDAKRRFKGTGVVVMTMDALSYNWYVGQGNDQKQHVAKRFSLDKTKATGTPTTRKDIARKFKPKPYRFTDSDGIEKELSSEDIAKMAIDAVSQFEISSDVEVGPQHFGKRKGSIFEEMPSSEIPPGAVDLAKKIWASKIDTKDPEGVQISNSTITKLMALDMPSIGNGEATGRKVDLVMIDEAQDLNPVFTDFAIGQKGLQKVTVGDPNQAIYGFRGARNEMDRMGAEADYVLPLTEVFRFGPELAGPGNRVLSLFNIMRGRMVGRGGSGEVIDPPGSMEKPDMILARTNAGVIKESMASLDAGRTVATTKRAYDELESFIESWKYLIGASKTPPANMHADLKEYDSYKDLKKDIDQGTASQKAKTLFNIGMDNKVEDLEKLLGSIFIWNPDDEGGESTLIEEPEDFEVGTLGIIGPATYEILDDEIVLYDSFEIKDWIKASGGWTFDFKNTKTWRKKASTPEERESALISLADALNNGTSGSDVDGAKIPSSLKNGDSGKFGKIEWEVRGGEIVLTGGTYPVKDRLDSVGWKLRKTSKKNPKTGKPIWETYYKLSGDQQEDLDMMEILAGIATGGAPMPSYASTIVKATDDEILEKARKIADKPTTEERDRDIIKNILASYERNGWLRRRAWETLEGKTKTKRETPPIDVRVLTAHLAKGLEADNVKLANDFWGPRQKMETVPGTGDKVPSGEVEWPDEEHMKVMYVALTRGKKTLDPGSASWIYGYTDEDDDLPEDPDPDRYLIGDEEAGLSSGRKRRKKASAQRAWSDEDRQRFADGNRLRAQTVPGKRKQGPTADEFRGLSSGAVRDVRTGLSSGGIREGIGESELFAGSKYIEQLYTPNLEMDVIPARDIYGDDTPGYAVVGRYLNSDGVEDWLYGGDDEIFSSVEDAVDFMVNFDRQLEQGIDPEDPRWQSVERARTTRKLRDPLEESMMRIAERLLYESGLNRGLSSGGGSADSRRNIPEVVASARNIEETVDRWETNLEADIYRARMGGMSLDDAAQTFGMSRADIRQAEIRHQARLQGVNKPSAKNELRRMRNTNLSINESARRAGIRPEVARQLEIIESNRGLSSGASLDPEDIQKTLDMVRAKAKLEEGVENLTPAEKRELRAQARVGDTAFGRLLESLRKTLTSQFRREKFQGAQQLGLDLDDLVSIGMTRIIKNISTFDPERSDRGIAESFKNWVLMTGIKGVSDELSARRGEVGGSRGIRTESIEARAGGRGVDKQEEIATDFNPDEAYFEGFQMNLREGQGDTAEASSSDAGGVSVSVAMDAEEGISYESVNAERTLYGKGFGYRVDNPKLRAEYDEALSDAYEKGTAVYKIRSDRPRKETFVKNGGFPTFEKWAKDEKGIENPKVIYAPIFDVDGNLQTGRDASPRYKSIMSKAKFGPISGNESNRAAEDPSKWMLPLSQFRKLFKTNDGKQMADVEIASLIGISESDIASWDDPDMGIDLETVRALLEEREIISKASGKNGTVTLTPGDLRRINSSIEDTWGFGSFPYMVATRVNNTTDAVDEIIETAEDYERLKRLAKKNPEEIRISGLTIDPKVLENEESTFIPLTNEQKAEFAKKGRIEKSKETAGRGSFPAELLGRKLGWISEGDDPDDPDVRKKLISGLQSVIHDLSEKTAQQMLRDGITADAVDRLASAGIIGSPREIASPSALADDPDVGKFISKNGAKDKIYNFLKELGLGDVQERSIFNAVFNSPTAQKEYVAKKAKEDSARELIPAGKIQMSKGGAGARVSITRDESKELVGKLNERLEKAGLSPVGNDFLLRSNGLSSGEGLSSGATFIRKKATANEVSNFVNIATQRGKISGAATRKEMLDPEVGQLQLSRLKNALRAYDVLADQFPRIADNPNMSINDIGTEDIDNPQEAISSIQKLQAYIRSISEQASESYEGQLAEERKIQYAESQRQKVQEMLDSLGDSDFEVSESLKETLQKLDSSISKSQAIIEQDYAPLARVRGQINDLINSVKGFSRNNGVSRQQRTKGARAASNKRLISI